MNKSFLFECDKLTPTVWICGEEGILIHDCRPVTGSVFTNQKGRIREATREPDWLMCDKCWQFLSEELSTFIKLMGIDFPKEEIVHEYILKKETEDRVTIYAKVKKQW